MKICCVDGCDKQYFAKGYCNRHYQQVKSHGTILIRTMYTLNTYWFEDCICYMQIYDRKQNPKCIVMIDKEDYEKVKDYKWSTTNINRVASYKVGLLSRFVMGITDPKIEVDHKFHNTLDNRKKYLRPCSKSENQANAYIRLDNISGYKGVMLYPQNKKWTSQVRFNKKCLNLGYFNTKEEAAKAYNKKAVELFGEFAFINTIRRLPR
jgi:hypothetical protein